MKSSTQEKNRVGTVLGGMNRRWLTRYVFSCDGCHRWFLLTFFLWPSDYSNDPRVVEIREIQEEARKQYLSNGGPSTKAEARAFVQSMEQVRTKMEGLPSADVRREMYRGSGNVFYSSMRQRIDDYFNASPAERQRVLDQQIRQSDLDEQCILPKLVLPVRFEENSGKRFSREKASRVVVARHGRSRSQGDRNDWFKDRILDRTTPEQRAKYVEYRRAASERREELGLPAGWP